MAFRKKKNAKKRRIYTKKEIQDFLDKEDLAYQKINLPHGLSTPGIDRSKETRYMFSEVEGKSVLDMGSYLGAYCFDAKRKGATRVVGLEINSHRVRQARKLNEFLGMDVEFKVCNMDKNIPFEKFDYVLNLNVLHRLDFPFKLFYQMMQMANDRVIMEFPGFNAEEARLVGYGKRFRKVKNDPVLWVAKGNAYVPGDRSKKWFISTRAVRNYFLYQHHYIGKLEIKKHGFKDRHVIVAYKRRYDKLIVIAGAMKGNYKNFLNEIKDGKHPKLVKEMGLKGIGNYPVITPKDIPKFDTVEAEGVVLLYDLVHPMIGEVCVEYNQDRVI